MVRSNDFKKTRVLLSVGGPSDKTNPFVSLLASHAEPNAESLYFSWSVFLLGKYDVLHLHWPEEIIRGRNRVYSILKSMLVLIMAGLLRMRRKPVLWTVHNPHPHEQLSWWEKYAYAALLKCVKHRVYLTQTMVGDYSGGLTIIPHGDYKPTLNAHLSVEQNIDFLYFGRIKPYKGVPGLLKLFSDNRDFPYLLRVCGQADDMAQSRGLEETAQNDDRITCFLDYLEESQLHREILSARVVVLPYQEMYNSGAILLALSLDRPVVVPSSPATDELSAEVGPHWVMTYQGELSTTILQKCLETRPKLGESPMLNDRSWSEIGKTYADVYEKVQRRGR